MINEFHQQYVEEAKSVLKNLEQSLLELGKNAQEEELNNVYRYLHTLKGSAGMFGFHLVEALSHELESVFQDIRDGARQLDEQILDLALHAVDVLGDLIDGKDANKEAEKIIASIKTGAGDGSVAEVALGGASGFERFFVIIIRPGKDIFKRGVNFPVVLEELQALGKHELVIHNESVPFEKQLAGKEIVSWFELMLNTNASEEEIRDVFMFMKPAEYTILEGDSKDIFSSEAYASHVKLDAEQLEKRRSIAEELTPKNKESIQLADNKAGQSGAPDLNEESVEEEKGSTVISQSRHGGHVSVATQKLDHLINIVSELVIFRTEIQHLMENAASPAVVEALEKLERLTLGLRDSAFNIRLVPLNILNVKLQRLVRSVSKELGKEIEFITEGLETELDRSMISALEAPLMHIIRNAIDHGIETPEERQRRNKPAKGLVKFYSYNSGDHVFIQLQDDGNGIDFDRIREKGIARGLLNKHQQYSEKELLNVMMMPGFSTAEKVTTVSGRGVGMDVVKKEIAALRGDIEVSTEKGLGSIFTLRLPLTLTILDTLVVKVENNKYLIPINEVERCYTEQHSTLFRKKSRQINHEGQLVPFISLREHFEIGSFPEEETVVVVNKNDKRIAVVVDNIIGTLQTVYKPLNEILHQADCFSGASILGDGSMALIINALKLKN